MISIEQARDYYKGSDASHDFEHVLRVLQLAERIGAAEGADMTVLHAAALLHDVARAAEHAGGPCHAQAGAKRAREILGDHDPSQVEAVAEAIASHRFRSQMSPHSLEARILFDADKLDAMGAIGIARAYALAGAMGQRLWGDVPEGYTQRTRDDGRTDLTASEHTPVHEYVFKLAHLRDSLYTPTARHIAAGRHAFMAMFFKRLGEEVEGRL